jgi:hypothetical protein
MYQEGWIIYFMECVSHYLEENDVVLNDIFDSACKAIQAHLDPNGRDRPLFIVTYTHIFVQTNYLNTLALIRSI